MKVYRMPGVARRCCIQFQAVETDSRNERLAFQCKRVSARLGSATNAGGSPGRRGLKRSWNWIAGHFFDRGDDFAHRTALARAQVCGEGFVAGLQMLESLYMRLSEIGHMNVVSNAGAVGCGIVGAEDLQFRSGAGRRAESERDEVTLGLMQFADFSAFVRSGCIEVAQAGEAKPVGTIVSFQRMFEEKLGNAIGIHWLPGRVLGDRNAGWFPVNRTSGGKDYLLHSRIDCGVQQGKPAFHIVAEVFSRDW